MPLTRSEKNNVQLGYVCTCNSCTPISCNLKITDIAVTLPIHVNTGTQGFPLQQLTAAMIDATHPICYRMKCGG